MSCRGLFVIAIASAFYGCTQSIAPTPPVNQNLPNVTATTQGVAPQLSRRMSSALSSKIDHVVIIVQENRTVNDLFNAFPGALTVRTAKNSFGKTVQLRPISLTAPYDISHRHDAFTTEFDNGKATGSISFLPAAERAPTVRRRACARTATCPRPR